VEGSSPVIELINIPTPVPSFVFVANDIVGLDDVLQQIPRAVIESPPSPDILPPLNAELLLMADTAFVVIIGNARVLPFCASFWQPPRRTINKNKGNTIFIFVFS
jgi:hypothetical protein